MRIYSLLLLLLLSTLSFAQSKFDIKLETVNIEEIAGLQSYTFAQSKGKILIIGGRLDGLHKRQPWATFDEAGHNRLLWVIDPENKKVWKKDLKELPLDLQEHLSSTNMQFVQKSDYLTIVGGYGISTTADDHISFPYICRIDVPSIIDAIINNKPIKDHISSQKDERWARTGGKLMLIKDTYYLVGGHRFDGRYNPRNGPSFTQTYKENILPFTLTHKDDKFTTKFGDLIENTDLLHRRDLNIIQHLDKDQAPYFTIYSGVFQKELDFPYIDVVEFNKGKLNKRSDFSQYFKQYHTANVPVFDPKNKQMTTFLIGGISQYYLEEGVLTSNNEIPFVPTISKITKTAEGQYQEYLSKDSLHARIGTAGEFIPVEKYVKDGVVIAPENLEKDEICIGYVFGGIKSDDANIFWVNDGTQSTAIPSLYKVVLKKTQNERYILNPQSIASARMQIMADAIEHILHVKIDSKESMTMTVELLNKKKKVMGTKTIAPAKQAVSTQKVQIKHKKLKFGNEYYVRLKYRKKTYLQKLIIPE